MIYSPDSYVILRIEVTNGIEYKILGAWNGRSISYADSWRINSGITSVDVDEKAYRIHGHSGSTYVVSQDPLTLNTFAAGILQQVLAGPTPVTVITMEELLESLTTGENI